MYSTRSHIYEIVQKYKLRRNFRDEMNCFHLRSSAAGDRTSWHLKKSHGQGQICPTDTLKACVADELSAEIDGKNITFWFL